MISEETIRDLNSAFQRSPRGFVVVDGGRPRFAVLDYETYQALSQKQVVGAKQTVKRVLVTGGAGYIGSHATRLLQKQGYEVVVYDNLSTGRKENVRGAKLIVADLLDKEALNKVFTDERFDAVMHFAAVLESEESVTDPAKYFEVNVTGGLNLLEAMRQHGVKYLIFSSSCAVYGDTGTLPITEDTPTLPASPYGLSKLMFEQMLRWYADAYGIYSISLRYFNAAGAWNDEGLGYEIGATHLIPQVLEVAAGRKSEVVVNGQDYETGDGTCIRDYIHVLDLAETHTLALQKLAALNGAHSYNLGTGRGSSILEIIDEAVEVTGRMIPMRIGPRRPGDAVKLWAETGKARRELNWQAKYNLRQILEDAWEWHRSRL